MPRLEDYIGERELLADGTYAFKFTEVDLNTASNKEHPTVQIKGTINDKKYTIFRYLHPNMLWLVAQEIVSLGAAKDREVDLHDAEQVKDLYAEFVGQTATVQVKTREYENRKSNDFRIKGIADGASFGAV